MLSLKIIYDGSTKWHKVIVSKATPNFTVLISHIFALVARLDLKGTHFTHIKLMNQIGRMSQISSFIEFMKKRSTQDTQMGPGSKKATQTL